MSEPLSAQAGLVLVFAVERLLLVFARIQSLLARRLCSRSSSPTPNLRRISSRSVPRPCEGASHWRTSSRVEERKPRRASGGELLQNGARRGHLLRSDAHRSQRRHPNNATRSAAARGRIRAPSRLGGSAHRPNTAPRPMLRNCRIVSPYRYITVPKDAQNNFIIVERVLIVNMLHFPSVKLL